MKRSAILSLGALLLALASPAPPANYDAVGLRLLQRLAATSQTRNVFISPVSIGVALAMASDGAAGETREAMLHTLGLEPDSGAANAALVAELKSNRDATVGIANALWLREDLRPRDAYVAHLQSDYGANAAALHFGEPSAAAAINAWTKEHTLGLIDHLIDDTNSNDVLYLTNALAFKGAWHEPFEPSDTHPAPFTDASGTTHPVTMMSRIGVFGTGSDHGVRVLRLHYGDDGYAAYVLMPDGNDLRPLLASLTAPHFDRLAASLTDERLTVELPRFTATYRTSLRDPLAAMGMGIAFSDHADFSAIRDVPPRLTISDVEHATYLHVDEAGTTAAAATSVGIRALAMAVVPKTFIVDHPFVFAIRDERIGALLFVGAIRTLPSAPSAAASR